MRDCSCWRNDVISSGMEITICKHLSDAGKGLRSVIDRSIIMKIRINLNDYDYEDRVGA